MIGEVLCPKTTSRCFTLARGLWSLPPWPRRSISASRYTLTCDQQQHIHRHAQMSVVQQWTREAISISSLERFSPLSTLTTTISTSTRTLIGTAHPSLSAHGHLLSKLKSRPPTSGSGMSTFIYHSYPSPLSQSAPRSPTSFPNEINSGGCAFRLALRDAELLRSDSVHLREFEDTRISAIVVPVVNACHSCNFNVCATEVEGK
jgi:hypothetical protein